MQIFPKIPKPTGNKKKWAWVFLNYDLIHMTSIKINDNCAVVGDIDGQLETISLVS